MSLIKEVLRHLPGLPRNEADPFEANISITLRPHHMWSASVHYALTRRQSASLIAERDIFGYYSRANSSGDPYGYYADVLGVAYQGRQEVQRATESFFTKLQDLPDDSFVHLDLKPDGLCETCVIGRHCSATNFTDDSRHSSIEKDEEWFLNKIRKVLKSRGYRSGIDFFSKPTTHTLYDFGGNTLNDPSEGKPKIIIFQSMIVRVGALRNITSWWSI